MPDVLLLDGPLRGQLAPSWNSGPIAYSAAEGLGFYTVRAYELAGRRVLIGLCELAPSALEVNDAIWEFLASDLAKALASTLDGTGASDSRESIRYVHADASAGGKGEQI